MVKIYSEIARHHTQDPVSGCKDPDASQKRNLGRQNSHQFMRKVYVLVADDEPTVCNLAKEMLEEIGMTVLTASDGNQAVELFKEHVDKITLVLLDLTMQALDGAQAFQEMRRLTRK